VRYKSVFVAIAIAAISSLATLQWASAQDAGSRPSTLYEESLQLAVKTGGDIGFRVERMERNQALGRLVVRMNGKWVDADFGVRLTPLSDR
jgi:hypothetical protein